MPNTLYGHALSCGCEIPNELKIFKVRSPVSANLGRYLVAGGPALAPLQYIDAELARS